MLTDPRWTREQVKEWLLSKGATLWSTFDLTQPERLEDAITWFLDEVVSCNTHIFVHTNNAIIDRLRKCTPPTWEPPLPPLADTVPPEWRPPRERFDVV